LLSLDFRLQFWLRQRLWERLCDYFYDWLRLWLRLWQRLRQRLRFWRWCEYAVSIRAANPHWRLCVHANAADCAEEYAVVSKQRIVRGSVHGARDDLHHEVIGVEVGVLRQHR
jgi:hypothetical protein